MQHAIRTQSDKKGDQASIDSGLDCSGDKDTARQEFKEETDINVLLKKFGINQQQRPLQYGEADYTMDYQQALRAIDETRVAFEKMSPEIHAKYPTWQLMVEALDNGELAKDLAALKAADAITQQEAKVKAELEAELTKERLKRKQRAAVMADRIERGLEPEGPNDPGNKPKE